MLTNLNNSKIESDDHLSDAQIAEKYASQVPVGYDTVIGYLAKCYPEVVVLMEDPITGTIGLGRDCAKQSEAIAVYAPTCFVKAGCHVINAYPLRILTEVVRNSL